jgi:hypothetical protein
MSLDHELLYLRLRYAMYRPQDAMVETYDGIMGMRSSRVPVELEVAARISLRRHKRALAIRCDAHSARLFRLTNDLVSALAG